MIPWLSDRLPRIAGIASLLGLWVLDVATDTYTFELRNGFWAMAGEKGFHVALGIGVVAACAMILLNRGVR